MRWQYGSYNVAKAFLKHPAAHLKHIVQALAEYKKSGKYIQRVAESESKKRSCSHGDMRATMCLDDPDDPVEQARCLRNEFMNAHRYAHNIGVVAVPTPETMHRYRTGDLLREANYATRRSGYGAIRDENACIVEVLKPAAFQDDLFADM